MATHKGDVIHYFSWILRKVERRSGNAGKPHTCHGVSAVLIAVAGDVAAAVAVETRSWWLFIFLIAGLIAAVLAFGFVIRCLFEESRWAHSPWLLAVGPIWVGVHLTSTGLGTSFFIVVGNSTAVDAVIALMAAEFVSGICIRVL